ncbi:hypothetical protein Pint_17959 [Pistacia integerrima]|uniref:Uncharacterized protein n=1 Tax=Pistacia integerrima TaxID=434235 RepID=A0ACC0Z0R4_9ROSI|nr:hypothetical protein Pint_17959 [Pistacia integerrima]
MAVFSHSNHLSLPLWDSFTLVHELNSTKFELAASHSFISELLQQLNSTNLLVEALLIELTREHERSTQKVASLLSGKFTADLSVGLPDEVRAALGSHKLPLGKSPMTGLDEVIALVGASWFKFQDELVQYMTYEIGGECPVDNVFAQRLLLKGCEPLPRRRCHPKSPLNYVEPTPFPEHLWAKALDTSIIWDPYSCKSYQCLIDRNNAPGVFACKDCFDLHGREKNRWLFDKGLDYGIDQVLSMKPRGTIRIGLDIGKSSTFAARMRERNVTIITTSMNFDGPFNSFIASRGLIPMHATGSHMPCLTRFDIYRVLRLGGLFWVDHFFCCGSQLNETHVLMFDRIGFRKRWNTGMKLDRGIDKNEWYFSALLEKSMTQDMCSLFS